MASLLGIPGIGKTSLDLLEAAGFPDAATLANADMPALARELERANSILKISKRTPTPAAVQQWILAARQIVGLPEELSAAPAAIPVNYERSPQVMTMLANAPFAIPLPARTLVDHQLGVADIPAALLLNRYAGDLDVKVEQRVPASRQPKPAATPNPYVRISDPGTARLDMDMSKLRSTENLGDPMPKKAATAAPVNDRVALIRAPLTATNKGRAPNSRWYIRGVLHSHPNSVYIGAIVTLLVMIMIPVSVIASALLLASTEMPEKFAWVPNWLLALPVALPLSGIAYLIFGLGGTCRVCGQKLFVHRSHLKNSKAHHVWGVGYILPLCAHILVFRWFRCTHCGTPLRLKQ